MNNRDLPRPDPVIHGSASAPPAGAPAASEPPDIALRRLAAIVESSDDAIVGKDLDGLVTTWNRGAEKIFGYTAAEMIGTSIMRLIPDDRQEEETHILGKIRCGEKVDHFETQRQTKDGRLIDVSVTASPIRGADGRVIGASKIARDITVLREREAEIARLLRLYAALSQVNQAIVWMPTRTELFDKVCRVLVEFGGFDMAWIGWHDAATQRLVPVAQCGDENDYLQGVEIHTDDRPTGRGPMGTAFREERACVGNDLFNDPAILPWRDEVQRRGWRASAAFPIRLQGAVGGVLTVHAREAGFFRAREIALLAEAAGDLSFALDNLAREAARREAEAVAMREKLFSETMIESMPAILYFYDDQGKFLRWNRNFENVSGYSGAEIARMHPLNFFTSADQRPLAERIAEVFAHGESAIEAPFLSKDGRTTPYFFTGRRIVFDGQPCLVGMGIDISEQKAAELALRDAELRFHTLFEQTPVGVVVIDPGTARIIECNEQAARQLGYSVAEFAALAVADFEAIETEESIRQRIETLLAEGRSAFETRHRTKSGEVRDVLVSARLIELGGRQLIHCVFLDISERQQAARALRELNETLEQKVTARTAELQAALVRAEVADRLKSAFLATMSHELRTPLNSIIGFTGTVLLGLPGPLNEEQKKQLGMVRGSARHLLDLINDVLDLSKIEAGQFNVRAEAFDLRAAIERTTGSVKGFAEKKGLTLEAIVAPGIGEMVSDRRRVEQIVLNLLNNAIKFTDRGGVTFTATLDPDFRRAPRFEPRAAVRLVVTDTGLGIKEEDLAKLFQPFQQVDTGLSRMHEGTGLGLAICRRLATLLGGRIAVQSTWAQGSEFTVTLPLKLPSFP